jgi:coenzyme F420-reducing hydrogenase alpha subunit
VKDSEVQVVRLNIFEPPRFFEAFLQGRHFNEIPSMVSRICGICPVAHQMSSAHALEQALGIQVEGPLRDLRRVLYLGEWIESHALHIYLLHAPDFAGCADAIEMAKTYPVEVQRGLQLKKLGRDIMTVLGGRAIHPINLKVGGFYKVPQKAELAPLIEQLKWAIDAAMATVYWVAKLPFPEYERDYEFVALRHPTEYPVNEGRLVSTKGLDIPVSQYEDHFVEEQVAHSNALHSRLIERGEYLVGPLARYNLNYDHLSDLTRELANEVGMSKVCRNPFQNILVRSLELVYACQEALQLLEAYQVPNRSAMEVVPHSGKGYSCTEAPRGMLYHHYELDEQGMVVAAHIVPPTAQNQSAIETDLKQFVNENLELSRHQLTWKCEQVIRNYDPCLSCATHFLTLDFDEE